MKARHSDLRFAAVACLSVLAASACSPQRPVLYPNAHYSTVGVESAQGDINQCVEIAEAQAISAKTAENTAGDVAYRTGAGAVGGAAVGAVRHSVGRGAAAGAASAGARSLFRAMFARKAPDPVHRKFVERCLRDKGYETAGWQ